MKKYADELRQPSRRTFLSISALAALNATVLGLPITSGAVK